MKSHYFSYRASVKSLASSKVSSVCQTAPFYSSVISIFVGERAPRCVSDVFLASQKRLSDDRQTAGNYRPWPRASLTHDRSPKKTTRDCHFLHFWCHICVCVCATLCYNIRTAGRSEAAERATGTIRGSETGRQIHLTTRERERMCTFQNLGALFTVYWYFPLFFNPPPLFVWRPEQRAVNFHRLCFWPPVSSYSSLLYNVFPHLLQKLKSHIRSG